MGVGIYATLSLPQQFNMAAYILDDNIDAGRGAQTAIYYKDETYSFNDICAVTNRVGNLLREIGVEREQRVLVILKDSPEWIASWLGAIKIGAVATHAYSYLVAEDYAYFLNYVRPKAVVVDEEILAKVREGAKHSRFPVKFLVKGSSASSLRKGVYNFDEMIQTADPVLEAEPTSRDDIACWNWSGGTTGRPKAVPHMHHDFAVAFNSFQQVVHYTPRDIILNVPKLFFHYAHDLGLNFPLRAGAGVILFPERTTPQIIFKLVARHHPTLLLNVPTMMRSMLQVPVEFRSDLSSIRINISSGESLSESLHQEWQAAFGVDVVESIGSAESYLGYILSRPGEKALGCVGKVAPLVEAKIVDEYGNEVTRGEQGILMIRADSVGVGYYLEHEKTKTTFLGNDWLNTGDIFRQDSDDNFYYVGRSGDLIKVSGVWISPLQIERHLQTHEKIKECVVLGAKDRDGLIKTKAYVVLHAAGEASEGLKAELVRFCKETLGGHKYPRTIEFLAELPKTGQGKIDRQALNQQA